MKAIQVKVKETMENGITQIWGGILVDDNTLIAADNGDIFSLNLASHLEIIKKYPWLSLSDEILGEVI